jgi:hypothetical protein
MRVYPHNLYFCFLPRGMTSDPGVWGRLSSAVCPAVHGIASSSCIVSWGEGQLPPVTDKNKFYRPDQLEGFKNVGRTQPHLLKSHKCWYMYQLLFTAVTVTVMEFVSFSWHCMIWLKYVIFKVPPFWRNLLPPSTGNETLIPWRWKQHFPFQVLVPTHHHPLSEITASLDSVQCHNNHCCSNMKECKTLCIEAQSHREGRGIDCSQQPQWGQ